MSSEIHWKHILFPDIPKEKYKSNRLGIDFVRTNKNEIIVNVTNNETITIRQESDDSRLGSVVWDCGMNMVDFLSQHNEIVKESYILELGCGTGIAGIAALKLGARYCIFTDFENIIPLTRQNIDLNNLKNASTMEYEWGSETTVFDKSFDVILCSDSLYFPESLDPLVKTLYNVCTDDTTVLFAYKKRFPEKEIRFFENLGNHFAITIESVDMESDIFIVSAKRLKPSTTCE